jgi:multidrug resistance efflux pump
MNTASNRQGARRGLRIAAGIACLLLGACGKDVAPAHDHPHAEGAAPTNRIDVNASVRQNLGMTFAKVETRRVARTLRLPGVFEIPDDGKRAYGARMGGTVEILVKRYAKVEPGTPLFTIDGPAWRQLKAELVDAETKIAAAAADVTATDAMIEAESARAAEVRKGVDVLSARVVVLEKLRASGGGREDDLAAAKADLVEMNIKAAESAARAAELRAKRVESSSRIDAGKARVAILLDAASALSGSSVDELAAASKDAPGTPTWKAIGRVVVKATDAGVVDSVDATSGAVIAEGANVVSIVKPDRMRFRAAVLQGDVEKVSSVTTGVVVKSTEGAGPSTSIAGTVSLAPVAGASQRTFDIHLTPNRSDASPVWAYPGTHAFLELTLASGAADDALAVPLRCIVKDGTTAIFFRRDPADPDKAIRMEADLGPSDGRWVVLQSGVAEGNEVVADGVHQLLVATSGSITKGGHFHPDGTFHEGDK